VPKIVLKAFICSFPFLTFVFSMEMAQHTAVGNLVLYAAVIGNHVPEESVEYCCVFRDANLISVI
jgi:hypothetical protein